MRLCPSHTGLARLERRSSRRSSASHACLWPGDILRPIFGRQPHCDCLGFCDIECASESQYLCEKLRGFLFLRLCPRSHEHLSFSSPSVQSRGALVQPLFSHWMPRASKQARDRPCISMGRTQRLSALPLWMRQVKGLCKPHGVGSRTIAAVS